jgi:hypothetical protein
VAFTKVLTTKKVNMADENRIFKPVETTIRRKLR